MEGSELVGCVGPGITGSGSTSSAEPLAKISCVALNFTGAKGSPVIIEPVISDAFSGNDVLSSRFAVPSTTATALASKPPQVMSFMAFRMGRHS
jgi:hypothetical protein